MGNVIEFFCFAVFLGSVFKREKICIFNYVESTKMLLNLNKKVGLLQIPNVRGFIQLTLKALITTAADDIHKYFFIVFQRK